MAHHSAAIKSIRQDAKRTVRNRERKSRVRTFVKNLEQAIAAGNKEEATVALRTAQKELLRAASKGVIKPGTAARKVSRLNRKVKALIEGKLNKSASSVKPKAKTAAAKRTATAKKAASVKKKADAKE